ncbi:hypothetical protein RHGRI_012430 [Rhododendron griersonianum]|uniref:F-box domain-containing protein n=1 Tax=Rhododendron griersonianum TaxID=479676 RepID=A0AAV6KQD1_9ERIC|nr:hypothetical protein RHGRI_012430 [Rhododendron griersonianum]
MKTEMPNLPEEIIFDVLSRLPVVSLCRFRCVSKPWRSLISHPSFIKTHLNRNTDKNTNKYERVVLSDHRNWYTVELDSSQFRHHSVAVRLDFPPGQNPRYCEEICYSCDGLVLMLDRGFRCCLVNPSTRESRKLPLSPFTSYSGFTDYGFGYDSSIDDYKVVNICYYDEEADAGSADNVVGVYALKTNSWRRIENSPYDHSCFGHHSGAFVCGALHWVARKGMDDVIVALVLADEKFRTLPSPAPDCIGALICVLGGCLCVFVRQFYPYYPDVWVMKEYGVKDSWMKFTVTCDNIYDPWRPLSLSRTGQVLLNEQGKNLVLFDPREEESKELVVQGLPTQFEVGTYVESLVSPKRQC